MKNSLLLLLIFWSNFVFGQYPGDEVILYQKYLTEKLSGETDLIEKIERSFDLDGNLLSEAKYEWYGFRGSLILVDEWTYKYSDDGLLVEWTHKTDDLTTTNEVMGTYSYQDECRTGLVELEFIDGILERRRIFQYEDCAIKSMEEDLFIDDSWVLEFREEHWINNGIEIKERFSYSAKEDNWKLIKGNYLQKDDRGNVIREENRDYLTTIILSDYYEYDANNILTIERHFEGTPNDLFFRNIGEFHYEFDENGLLVSENSYKQKFLSGPVFLSGNKSFEYVYDEDGLVIEQHIDEISSISPINGNVRRFPTVVNHFDYFCDGKLRKKSNRNEIVANVTELYHYKEANPCLVPAEDRTPDNIFVYPNPATSIVTFQSELFLNGDCEVYLFDAVGKLIRQEHIGFMVNESQMNIGNLGEGVYFIHLCSADRRALGKLVITK